MARLAKALSAAAGSAGGDKVYVEDVFSTHLYDGTSGTSLSINNGIDLAGEGGLVWIKERSGGGGHILFSTDASGNHSGLLVSSSSGSAGTGYQPTYFTQNNNGFTTTNTVGDSKTNGNEYASYSFRKQEGFFDIVTWTGNSTASRAISHGLNAKVGTILVKCTSDARPWPVYHSSVPTGYGYLNSTGAFFSGSGNGVFGDASYNNIAPTTSVFYVGSDSEVNGTGLTYVAYVFAEGTDSGSQIFGDDGDEAIIKCGSYQSTGNNDEVFVDLGFEPQWIMIKNSSDSSGQNWHMQDTMRGMAHQSINPYLLANTNGAENSVGTAGWARADASGVTIGVAGAINMFNSVQTYTYIAIRRGPMKEPDAGTDVFQPIATSGDNPNTTTATFPWDTQFNTFTNTAYSGYNNQINDRLRGVGFLPSFTTTPHLTTANRDAQTVSSSFLALKGNGMDVDKSTGWGASSTTIFHNFRRYPKVFDVVVYTAGTGPGVTSGDGTSSVVPHNLTVAPELIIGKDLDDGGAHWGVAFTSQGNGNSGQLNTDAAISGGSILNSTNPTATSLNVSGSIAGYGNRNVLLLFSTLAGISKVGTYSGTGTGTTVDVDCGFSAGARYILIKRTDSTGDWFVYDSARGIVSGDSPYILLNSTAGQVNTDYIDPLSSGFQVTTDAAVTSTLNVSGATYAFLAIA